MELPRQHVNFLRLTTAYRTRLAALHRIPDGSEAFVEEFTPDRSNVGVLKTSGGPFDLLSGSRARAPLLEWAWRIRLEPRRLFWRYLTTNPRALYLLLN